MTFSVDVTHHRFLCDHSFENFLNGSTEQMNLSSLYHFPVLSYLALRVFFCSHKLY